MAKKSLILTDKEKYGPNSPQSIMPMGAGEGGKKGKKDSPKHAPTIDLCCGQVDSFGLQKASVGEKGCAMIHYIVKSNSAGESYGDEVPGKNTTQKVVLSITHVDPDCEAPADDEKAEGADDDDEEEEEGEEGAEDPEGKGDAAEASADEDPALDEDDSPKAPTQEKVSPADALGDDE